MVMNASGAAHPITLPETCGVHIALSGGCGRAGPNWSPDGSRILATDRCPWGDVWTFDPDGTNAVKLTTGGAAQDALWSRQGDKIAFLKRVTSQGYTLPSLWVMAFDGTSKRRLSDVGEGGTYLYNFAWGP
jgi:Tol biopolymer transport system component